MSSSSGTLWTLSIANWGVYGLARFLRVYRAGTGDYTRDRHPWLQGLTVQELAKEFEGRQA